MCRAQTQGEAESKFEAYQTRIPDFVQKVKTMYNVTDLKMICEILNVNPSWSMAHLVAYFGYVEHLFQPPEDKRNHHPDRDTRMTPFQVAIKKNNIGIVNALIGSAELHHLDKNSDSMFHHAANSSNIMITILSNKSKIRLTLRNKAGFTPLEVACMSNHECVIALLGAGAGAKIPTSSKFFTTLLSADLVS